MTELNDHLYRIMCGDLTLWHYTSSLSVKGILRDEQVFSGKHFSDDHYPAQGWQYPAIERDEWLEARRTGGSWFSAEQRWELNARLGHRVNFASTPETLLREGITPFRIGVKWVDVRWHSFVEKFGPPYHFLTLLPVKLDVWRAFQWFDGESWTGWNEFDIAEFKVKLARTKAYDRENGTDSFTPDALPPAKEFFDLKVMKYVLEFEKRFFEAKNKN